MWIVCGAISIFFFLVAWLMMLNKNTKALWAAGCSLSFVALTLLMEYKLVLDFVNKEEPDLIITHCKAGVCRSAAVNAALSKIILERDDIFFKEGVPNMLVYTTILNAWFVDLIQCSEKHKDISAKHLYPWIYKMRVKYFKRIH